MHQILRRYAVIALSALGSATLLFSCSNKTEATQYDYETLMTESSENRTITMMENGRRSYTFVTPLMEGYSMSTNPYQEFRRGIRLVTYQQDTITIVADTTYIANQIDATITANYAIYYEKQDLWEAKGDVVVIKNERDDGDTLVMSTTEVYTQQLYWDAKIGRIYSNVDTRVITADGPQYGEGFDTDEKLTEIHFRKYVGEVEFDFTPAPMDSTAVDEKGAMKSEGNKRGSEIKAPSREIAPKSTPNNDPKLMVDTKPLPINAQRPVSADMKSTNAKLDATLRSDL